MFQAIKIYKYIKFDDRCKGNNPYKACEHLCEHFHEQYEHFYEHLKKSTASKRGGKEGTGI